MLAIGYQGRHILLTGDLESPGLNDVVNGEPFECDILQMPHHGSINSDPESMIAWARPKWSFIAGASTDGLQTAPIYQAYGAKVLNTAQCGAITAEIKDGELRVECFHPEAMAADAN